MSFSWIIAHFFDEVTAASLKDAVLVVFVVAAIAVFMRVASNLMNASIPFNVSTQLISSA
jgi:ABC-type transport system involved in cytochrome bd biosynthesis fused ATPase/permease subunit